MIELKNGFKIKDTGLKIIFWEIEDILYALKLRDINSNELFYVLISEDEEGRLSKPLIVEELGKGRKPVLSKFGFDIEDKELLEVEKFLSKTNTIPERVFYNSTGFHLTSRGDMCFNGSELVSMGYITTKKKKKDFTFDTVDSTPECIRKFENIVMKDESELLFETDSNLLKNEIEDDNGTLDAAIEFYRNKVTTEGMRLAVATGFASPIVHLLGQKPILLNLYGETSKGKTTSSMLISSLFSEPDDSRLMVNFNRTLMSLEKHLEGFKGIPLVVDDTSTNKGKEAIGSEFVYALAAGKGRTRLDVKEGFTPTKPGSWANSIIMSSELSIMEYCEPKKMGVLRRLIEFEVTDRSLTLDAEHADKIEKFTQSNYGQLGTAFIREIASNYQDEKALWDLFESEQAELIKLAKNQGKVDTAGELDNRLSGYIKMVTPITMAVVILKDNMKIDFNINDIRETLLSLFEKNKVRLGKKFGRKRGIDNNGGK